jgi:lysophospholipase L1-like esterase
MPHVVIWQLGVNDVLVADGVGDRRAKMLEGLRALTERRIPVMLLDLQYAPRVLRDPDTEAMQAMIEQATANGGVVYRFKRYAAMKHLVERENLAVDKLIEADGLHMTLSMHDCIGRLLAEAIQEKTDVETALR